MPILPADHNDYLLYIEIFIVFYLLGFERFRILEFQNWDIR